MNSDAGEKKVNTKGNKLSKHMVQPLEKGYSSK